MRTLTRFAQQRRQKQIHVLLHVRRLFEADAPRHVLKVVVAQLERDGAETLPVFADLGRESICDGSQMGEDESVVGYVLEESLLLPVTLRFRSFTHHLAIIDARA